MLTKATAHFRPFIRLPSSGAGPDHFTANPSLLHHLPHNGAGNALVGQSQSSTQTAGGSGGAGRHGYGGNAGAGGGYTGHARAFLSLPQTSAVDPSSTLQNSDDNQLQSSSSSHGNLLLRHRLSKRTRIIGPSDGVGREVRREIEARSSGNKVKVLEIDGGEEADWKEEKLALPAGRGRRRSSIAFPSNDGLSSFTPTHQAESSTTPPRPSTPRQRAALTRSQTTLEVWQVGIPRPRAQLGLRSLSTRADARSSAASEPLVSTSSTTATRVLSQPNRVLMDLAGRDLPGRRIGMARRNSTAAVERATLDRSPFELSSKPAANTSNPVSDKREAAIDHALISARDADDEQLAEQLVRHYRSSREASPFAPDQHIGEPALATQYPLPDGYSRRVYNTCMNVLFHFRKSGHSIAPILEIYNEFLERDLIPDSRTYGFVIRALALRSTEISDAVKQWEEQKKWGLWRAGLAGEETWNAEDAARRDETLASYQAENNLNSALKLFRAAYMTNTAAGFALPVYGTLLQAMSREPNPDVEGMLQIKKAARLNQTPGRLSLFQWVFRAMGDAKHAEKLEQAWKQFSDRAETPSGEKDWSAGLGVKKAENEAMARRVEGLRSETWESAMEAFIAAGQVDKGVQLFQDMVDTLQTSQTGESIDYTRAPAATHRTCGELVSALAKAGQFDLALEWSSKINNSDFIQNMPLTRLTLDHVARITDVFILGGRPDDAAKFMSTVVSKYDEFNTNASKSSVGRRLWRIYTAWVCRAAQSSPSERGALLDQIKELGTSGLIPFDVIIVCRHLALLSEAGRYDEIPSVLETFRPASAPRPEHQAQLLAALKNCATNGMPLQALLGSIRSASKHSTRPDNNLAESVIAKYVEERGRAASDKVYLTPQSSFDLIELFAALQTSKVSEGDYDDALLALLEDLAAVSQANGKFLGDSSKNHTVLSFVRHLTHRFGVERSTHLLAPIFGEEEAQQMTAPKSTASPSVSASATSSPESADGSAFVVPSPASSATSAPSVGAPEYNLFIDRSLSASVERFTQRNPRITPLQAYDLVRQGLGRNAVPYPNVLCQLIDHLARAGDEPKVRELYSLAQAVLSTITRPEDQANDWQRVEDAMLIASCHLGHLEQAGMHRARIVEAGMTPSADAYATMIASSKDTTDDALVARELFDESQAMGVKPHLYLYNTIISKLSKARKAETALELFQHMKAAGIRPSSVTYGAVINACCRVGDAQSAETLFEEMASQPNFRARVPPFNTMMQFYLQTQPNRDRVLYYYNALQTAQVPPSAHTYKLLLDTYATLAPIDLEAMENVFSEIQANRSVPIQGTHWASLITAYGLYANDPAKAKDVFDQIPSRGAKEAVVWEAMLNVISQRGTLEELESTRQNMISSGVQPTAYVYNALINGYSRANEITKARELFESMGDSISGVAAPNNHPTLLTSSGHVKPNTLTNQPTNVVYKEPSTYEAMIRAEVRAGDRVKAEEVLKRMEERGYPVAVYMRGRAAFDEIST